MLYANGCYANHEIQKYVHGSKPKSALEQRPPLFTLKANKNIACSKTNTMCIVRRQFNKKPLFYSSIIPLKELARHNTGRWIWWILPLFYNTSERLWYATTDATWTAKTVIFFKEEKRKKKRKKKKREEKRKKEKKKEKKKRERERERERERKKKEKKKAPLFKV